MASTTATTSTSQSSDYPDSNAHKGAVFLRALYEMTQSDTGRVAIAGTKVGLENIKLVGMGALDPKSQGILLTSVMIRKALHFAGIAEPSQGIACVTAVAQAGTTMAVVSAKVGASTVVSAGTLAVPAVFIGVVVLALESYHVGNACFVNNGNVSHKIAK